MSMFLKVLLILFIFAPPVLAANDAPVFTDQDLEMYGGSSSATEKGTSIETPGRGGDSLSPLENDLRRRKDDVVKDNRDYIEREYGRMKEDCNKYQGDLRKDCYFGTESWYKKELNQLEDLRDYLSK
jgi:hypothetical protein